MSRAVFCGADGRWRDKRGAYARPPGLQRQAAAKAAATVLRELPADSPHRSRLEYTARTGLLPKERP